MYFIFLKYHCMFNETCKLSNSYLIKEFLKLCPLHSRVLLAFENAFVNIGISDDIFEDDVTYIQINGSL